MKFKKQINLYILASLLSPCLICAKDKEDEVKPVSQFGNSVLSVGSAVSALYFTRRIVETIADDPNKVLDRDGFCKLGAWALAVNALANVAYRASLRTPAKTVVLKLSDMTKSNLKKIGSYFYC